jgi:hypothetical protein
MNLDLTARRVVVASMLYYGLDSSMMSDAEFDESCKRLAAQFDQLDPVRQWQLESAEAISASGYQVKVTQAAASAAVQWLVGQGDHRPVQRLKAWRNPRPNKAPLCRFLLPGDFRFVA